MQILIVSSKEDIPNISPDERLIHLAFRPSGEDIFSIIGLCPNAEVIQLPPSYIRGVSKAALRLAQMQNITFIEGTIWGHREDVNPHYEVPKVVLDKISLLKEEGLRPAEIAGIVDSKLSGGMIAYIAGRV
jgi:hypothetical protein